MGLIHFYDNFTVVGAPTEENIGKLYSCNLDAAFDKEEITCREFFIAVDEPEYEDGTYNTSVKGNVFRVILTF